MFLSGSVPVQVQVRVAVGAHEPQLLLRLPEPPVDVRRHWRLRRVLQILQGRHRHREGVHRHRGGVRQRGGCRDGSTGAIKPATACWRILQRCNQAGNGLQHLTTDWARTSGWGNAGEKV